MKTVAPDFGIFLSKLSSLDENNAFKEFLPSEESLIKMEKKAKEDRRSALELIKNSNFLLGVYTKIMVFLEKSVEEPSLIDYRKIIAEQAGISDDELLMIYKVSLEFYEEKNFDKAIVIAGLLSFLNPEISAFWRMQGACFYQLNDFNAALIVYLFASMINSLEILNHIACMECLLRLGFTEAALSYYNTAREVLNMADQTHDLLVLDEFFKKA